MRGIEDLLGDVPMFAGMEPERLELLAGCGSNRVFKDGDYLLREGEQADTFFAIRDGDVALETFAPQRGALRLETLHPGDVLGWSWLVPPHRTMFDARASGTVRALAFDGRCLRAKCEQDQSLGYDLLTRFVTVLAERLQATRLQLLDVYGHGAR
jgi:CRP-like cAMP-binding protein